MSRQTPGPGEGKFDNNRQTSRKKVIMDTKKNRKDPLPPLDQTYVKKLAQAAAKQSDMDEDGCTAGLEGG